MNTDGFEPAARPRSINSAHSGQRPAVESAFRKQCTQLEQVVPVALVAGTAVAGWEILRDLRARRLPYLDGRSAAEDARWKFGFIDGRHPSGAPPATATTFVA
jgi:hypothetical protein